MNTRRNNVVYISFLAFTIAALAFFISIPIIKAAKYERHSVDYNKIVSMGSYHLKISNATYLKDTKELCFALSVKAQDYSSHESSEPEISTYKLSFYDDNDKYRTEDMLGKFTVSERNSMTDIITVPDVSADYDYVYLELTCTTEAYDDPDTRDEFGDIVKGEHHPEKTYEQYFMFDRKDISVSDSKTEESKVYDIVIEDESNDSVETTAAKSNDDEKKEATVPAEDKRSDDLSSETTTETESKTAAADSKADDKTDNKSVTKSAENERRDVGYERQNVTDNDNVHNDQQYEQDTGKHENTVQQPAQTTASQSAASRETSAKTTAATAVKARSIRLETDYSNNNVILNIGESTTLRAVIEPSDAADRSVIWESNRPDIISVDSSGVVHAEGSGKAIITARLSGNTAMSASCMVTAE